ncbi:peptidoglycan DD-metalloendopeptidase family protein [Sulfitobacter sp. M57]|uniref:murein hydrolase activator EnvC family protein n=1 Tax=unclassified Sulfitobacter TaxID=196795 RepID=UPI0023E23FB7|nr:MULTISPECIES: peptidoglycan DD-metalloendopeptidase family protein [unclassified Sulfitobacter]MDF3415272.1 peptidoglycan DD-metalloendopeptidase family protein [Sulfitobacter sp. KE5]MDF3422753.1 peptidoglycan DD-metalloendopeptidase family protein [Sulfitobacter sp. KE43]MDF3433818.1 peptidoglycan DD-metalloendopeptidase family protein [Sulfitobacter sp. KE42]MDF3459458.1 peptidoglycan DD-metalloendopeptidase family protein [Sulfitobacter sp. S74]MDF3463357.1 peptidoglycan DD-metalloendop
MKRFVLILALWWPAVATAQSTEEQARAAVSALEAASIMLDQADGARDRVRALTRTIQAFETGLGAMRAGLRQAAINEAQLTTKLASRDGEVADLLGVLQSMGGAPSPVILLHPEGPTGTARAGMLLAELTPALNRRADALRRDLENVQTLRALQTDAAKRLQLGLTEVQAARTALNQAMAERTDLPKRFTEDPVRTGILIASTETLDGFASGLSEIVTDEVEPAPVTLDGQIGALPLPAQGLVLRRAGEADAAGVKRPGLILATRPGAIVTSPTAATIRYVGGLLDFGNVVILEPQANTLFVIAGLDVVYGETGQVIAGGTPIGLMGGAIAQTGEELSPLREGAGTERSETLYIEVREENTPQDPELWFRTDEDG